MIVYRASRAWTVVQPNVRARRVARVARRRAAGSRAARGRRYLIHIGARPFEDSGTDWTEMLTLTSQLFLLVAGPVFKTLVSDRRSRLHCAQPTTIGDAAE